MKIKKIKSQLRNLQKGYTLVELLAVIVVLVVVGAITTSIIVSTLRGSNRSRAVNNVRQNGDFVLSQMSKMIAYSKVFDGISTDGTNYVTDCTSQSTSPLTPTPIPTQYSYLKISSFDGGSTVFFCGGSPDTIASNGASMVDNSSINVASCYFICTQTTLLTPPTIDIYLTLSEINSGSLFAENNVTIPFVTSVTPRNY